MSREPARDRYDAIVDLFPPKQANNFAYAIVKLTYEVVDGQAVLAAPRPLEHDLRDPELEPKMPVGSDFWPGKDATDLIVRGSAHARAPVQETWVGVQVGQTTKHVKVIGQRYVEWQGSTPYFSAPEPFEEMPIVNANAYGGCDLRVPVDPPRNLKEEVDLTYDHPGVYPRNPFGKGYLVSPEPPPDPELRVPLPNLEDPADPLTPERLIVGDPKLWWRQPLPWTYDWHHPLMFPRYVYMGADAWFPGPQDASMAEVARGFLPANYQRDYVASFSLLRPCPGAFFQEASLGLSFADLQPGTPITVAGMHPDGRQISFALPPPPALQIGIEKQVEQVRARLSHVVIDPAESTFSLTWVGRCDKMPRKFIPGIHAKIPLLLWVDRDEPIVYETPKTLKQQMAEAEEGGGPDSEGSS